MADRLICKKVANALVLGVRLKPWVSFLLAWQTLGVVNTRLRASEKRQGGLWVGGTLSVYEGGVSFEPNHLNRAVQEGELVSELEWSEVLGINIRFGIMTHIIELSHAHGAQAFRCFGAKRLAAEMNEAWRAATA